MVHVFLYVPNIIGYVRVALALASMFFALAEPRKFVAIYSFSMWLDAVDGVAARALKQSMPRSCCARDLQPFKSCCVLARQLPGSELCLTWSPIGAFSMRALCAACNCWC